TEDEIEDGPGAAYQVFLNMEAVLDNLKLLDYDREYCKQLHHKPISRHYFAMATNSGEQFHAFGCLASWLVRMGGKDMEEPQEYDDPNAIVSGILDAVRSLGHSIDFPPSKLKSGSGPQVVYVLLKLSEEALQVRRFVFDKPRYPTDAGEDHVDVIEDESESAVKTLDDQGGVADEFSDDDFIEDEDNVPDVDGLAKMAAAASAAAGGSQGDAVLKPEVILESNTDSTEWMLEVERVQPQLKVVLRAEGKDWRVHLDSMHQYQKAIGDCYGQVQQQLKRMEEDIGRSLEKLGSREKYLNSQVEGALRELRAAQDRLAEARERYKQASGGINDRGRQLQEISEELERVKSEMEERGNSMTDGSPLMRIKKALQRLKNELKEMDIRAGVLQHILLQTKLREKTLRGAMATEEAGYLF
ncbi:hypothetical protein BOX15_Mlig003518g4, partial [Macrostomum lignano]